MTAPHSRSTRSIVALFVLEALVTLAAAIYVATDERWFNAACWLIFAVSFLGVAVFEWRYRS